MNVVLCVCQPRAINSVVQKNDCASELRAFSVVMKYATRISRMMSRALSLTNARARVTMKASKKCYANINLEEYDVIETKLNKIG